MAGRITMQGANELIRELRSRLGSAAEKVEKRALKAAGGPIAEAMRARVNLSDRTTLHMRNEIKVSRVIRRDGEKYVLVGAGKKTGWRTHFMEYGTSKMAPQPFVEPAFHEKKDEAVRILGAEFERGLRSR